MKKVGARGDQNEEDIHNAIIIDRNHELSRLHKSEISSDSQAN